MEEVRIRRGTVRSVNEIIMVAGVCPRLHLWRMIIIIIMMMMMMMMEIIVGRRRRRRVVVLIKMSNRGN